MGSQRSSIEIMLSVLEVAQEQRFRHVQSDGGVPITKRSLMRSANLNHAQLTNYLDKLEQKGFIITDESSRGLFLEITEPGLAFMDQAEQVVDAVRGD